MSFHLASHADGVRWGRSNGSPLADETSADCFALVDDRPVFDANIASTPAVAGVIYEPDSLGDVPGWWCLPEQRSPEAAILYLHGGSFISGSAAAYRRFVSHLAAQAGMSAFVADYSLAPERPYPAARHDTIGHIAA